MKSKNNIFMAIRCCIYFALILGSIIVLAVEFSTSSWEQTLFFILMITGIVGIFFEIYKK